MIAEFERRIAAMPEPTVQVTFAAMVLGKDDATSERSRLWFEERAETALQELEKRGSRPEPLPTHAVEPSRGHVAHNRSLTQEQAEEIRGWWERRVSVPELARHFSVSETAIRRIINNETYRELA